MYDTVVSILRSDPYNWPADCAPEPDALAEATGTPGDLAATLDGYCRRGAESYGWGGVQPGSEAAYVQCRHLYFAQNTKFWKLSTRLALGLIVEIPEDKVAPAYTVTDWVRNLDMGRDYLGYRNHDPASEEGIARRARRVPLEWIGQPDTWRLFALSGYDADLDNQWGLWPQQALDNLWARQKGIPIPWLPLTRANQ